MLYRSRISRSRFTGSNSFGASIMFFTSGLPTRSIRTLSLPRVSVSATTPTRPAPPSSRVSSSMTRLSTFLPSRKIEPGSVNASSWVASVVRAARASMMNGSHRVPAKTRMPSPAPPCGSFTRNETDSPVEDGAGAFLDGHGHRRGPARRRHSRGRTPRRRGRTASLDRPPSGGSSGRSLKRYSSPSENRSEGLAIGSVFTTSTRRSACSGLGNAYTSVMSAIGSARARGPEMWSDIGRRSRSRRPASRRPRRAAAASPDARGARRPPGGRAPAGRPRSRVGPSGSP